jgi:pimeloyl-ACP methyl ester carboxylesterase
VNPRLFTPGRIVALTLIALVVCGLGYLRFGPSDSIAVPDGAKAGDLTLESCTYATEDGGYPADCGTLVVPENRNDPQSRLIALPVTRIKAKSNAPAEPIFRLEGGPGKTNMNFTMASRYVQDHDVVLVGYRGADGSSVLDCPEVVSALKHSVNFGSEKSYRAYGDGFRACAQRLQEAGVDLAGYNVVQRADDVESARKALGYDRINLVSESAGTRYAMIYAWRYPTNVHRSVMIGVNPPGNFLWKTKTTDEQIARYAKYCSKDADCSKRTDDLAAVMRQTDIPKRWGFLPIKDGNVRTATFYGLTETTSDAAPISGPMSIGSWLSAADGDASGFWFQSLLADLAFPKSFVWGEMAAMAQADDRAADRYYASGDRLAATDFIWGEGQLNEAWPSSPENGLYDTVRTSNVDTLLIGGELDFATPPQVATKELLPSLPNGKQIVLPGFGHSTSFWTQQPEAGTRLIEAYLASGKVDDSLYKPQAVDFTPEVSQTALGKGFAATMIALPVLAFLSLLWMAVRVRRRGGYGRKASMALRSVYPIVLGLAGWLGGVLLVITTMPGTPLDNQLLAMLSIGLPVGLGIFLAWFHGDRPSQANGIGLAAALGGGLVGALLGFHATLDLAALLTAIGGAIVSANLTLILFDLAQAHAARERAASSAAPLEPASPAGA